MRPSGSRWSLLRACAWWARPEVQVERVSSDAADAGTDKHSVLESLVDGVVCEPEIHAAAWGCEPQDWPAIEANIREWLPMIGATETAIYYDPATDTARRDDTKGRRYECADGEIPMTVDLVRTHEGMIEVWDYKTGRQDGLEPAATNGQLAICSLAVARLTGNVAARGVLAMVRDDGTAYLDRVEYDSLDLDAIAYEARGLLAQIPTSQPNPGPWCGSKWCPARAVCPATQQAIVATPMAPLSITIDSAEACARVHTQIALAEEFLDAVKRARNAWLEENPGGCELADGSRLEMGVEERDSIDLTPAAIAALESAGCAGAIEPRTSKAAIEREIKRTAPKGEAASRMRSVLESLDAAHAIKTNQFTKIRVRKGRKAA